MKDKIKTIQTTIEQTVDQRSGELIDIRAKYIKIVTNPDEFALVYAGLWNVILDNKMSTSDMELLAFLIKNYSDGNPFTINSYVKKQVCTQTDKHYTSYNNSTRKLLDLHLIFAVEENSRIYLLNPRYAFKGSSKNRNKAIIEMVDYCVNC